MKRKQVLIRAFCATNFGDDLFIKLLCQKYPNTYFYLQCPKKHMAPFVGIKNLRIIQAKSFKSVIYRFIKSIAPNRIYNLKKLDAVVYIAGSIFIENKGIDGNQAEFLSKQIIKGVPFFIIGANFGPYYTDKYVQDNREVLKSLKDVCFRDRESYELFSDLRNVRWAPDCLFNYNVKDFANIAQKRKVSISLVKNNGRSGFFDYDENQYLNKIIDLALTYYKKDYDIVFLNLCAAQKDNEAIEYCLSKLPKSKKIAVCNYEGNERAVLNEIASSEYVIASRFHAMIFSWLLRRPVFPIVYGDKTINAIKAYGFCGDYVSIESIEQIDFATVDKNRLNQYIFDVDSLTFEANRQFQMFDSYINEV